MKWLLLSHPIMNYWHIVNNMLDYSNQVTIYDAKK